MTVQSNLFNSYSNKLILYVVITLYCYLCVSGDTVSIDYGKYQVTYLDVPGKRVNCCSHPLHVLHIFCYRGTERELINMWQTVSMELSLAHDDYSRYDGSSPQEVILEYEADRSSWSLQMFTWKEKNIQLNPFNSSCVGIYSKSPKFVIFLNVIRIDFWRPLFLLCGMSLYVMAPKLSGNPLFYYICGISFGVCASLLVLVYIISRLIPTRPMMYSFVIGGWAVGIYLIQMLWDNLRLIAFQYQSRVLSYVAVTGVISFVVCYRMGPVTDPRSKNLIMWTLQAFSLFLMYTSSQFHEAALAIIFFFLGYQHFPPFLRLSVISFWKKRFPPQVKNLTDEEYYLQGIKATNEGIKELRRYCSSPDCDAWKTMSRLKDPTRFAKFVSGASHIDDDEVMNYEVTDSQADNITDDDSD